MKEGVCRPGATSFPQHLPRGHEEASTGALA